jgi:hypothetical protein
MEPMLYPLLMSAISISFGVLIVLFAILLLHECATPNADRWLQIAKNVPVVRLDHVPIEDILPGMRQVLAMTTKANN